jgi:Fe-S cluster biogenesis protein NfuA
MDASLNDRLGRIDKLVALIRDAPDSEVRSAALELVESVMEFEGTAIDRMMELASLAGEPGWRIIETFGRDELVSHLLLLHGLHPLDLETRVRGALDKIRPYLQSHGGNVDLLSVTDGVVHLRLIGSCDGCPSSAMTLKSAIEKNIYEAAPDVISIVCEGKTELVAIQNAG